MHSVWQISVFCAIDFACSVCPYAVESHSDLAKSITQLASQLAPFQAQNCSLHHTGTMTELRAHVNLTTKGTCERREEGKNKKTTNRGFVEFK